MPYLNIESALCLDLPGHGQTSHIPRGVPLHYIEYILTLRYVLTKYFKWDEVSLLGHSFGSSLCFSYAGLFPNHVKQMVNMECSRPWLVASVNKLAIQFRQTAEDYSQDFKIDDNDSRGFSWEETIARLYEARKDNLPISKKSCEIIAKRGTIKISENKYRFSHDKRLKFRGFSRFTKELQDELAERVSCKALNLEASKGLASLMADSNVWHEHLKKMTNSNLVSITVEGGHHIHLESPEVVAPSLNDFFSS